MFTEKFIDNFLTESELVSKYNCSIHNEIITSIDIKIVGHFGNTCSLVVKGYKGSTMIDGYNNTINPGRVIGNLLEFFNVDTGNGVLLSEIHDIPVRVAIDDEGYIIALGHFIQDVFVEVDDLLRCV